MLKMSLFVSDELEFVSADVVNSGSRVPLTSFLGGSNWKCDQWPLREVIDGADVPDAVGRNAPISCESVQESPVALGLSSSVFALVPNRELNGLFTAWAPSYRKS